MDIQELFPEDPCEPTVEYAGFTQAPFSVPWAEGRVRLGVGFNTQRTNNDSLFLQRCAFRAMTDAPLRYQECQSTSINDESGTDIATSSEDTTFTISASIGGSFLGVSGRGSYEKSIRDNKNKSSISIRAEHICGQIDTIGLPKLDNNAVRLLKTSPNPVVEFRETYGDFYVAGYRVGAVNSTTVSGDLANKTFFEAKEAELKIKAMFVTVSKSISEVEQSRSDVGGLSVSAFDSLEAFTSNFTARTVNDSLRAGDVAAENKQRAMNIANRAANVLYNEFSLGHGRVVYQDAVDRLCDRGLVTELLLAPFALLREYQSILLRRFNKPQS